LEGFIKYTAEMGSGAMKYMPSFIKIGWGIQTLIERIYIHRQQGHLIYILLFYQNQESRHKKTPPFLLSM
jgi:hypothetical protein